MQILTLLVPILALQGGGKLQIKDTKVGKGEAAQVGDYLAMEYTGTLLNGKQFDSSKGRPPFQFVLGAGQVIKGWDQGLVGIKVGGKRTLVIPASLAYGSRDMGDIPPNSTLKFEVELRSIDRIKKEVLKAGKGEPAKAGDTVSLHYKGTLKDGKKFDSSYDRNEPFPVTIGQTQVIPGFTMGILGMRQGEKRRITIPGHLGYGSQGAGGVIPPNATLIFELEALKVSK